MKRCILPILAACCLLWPFAANASTIQLVTGNYPPYEYEEDGQTKGIVVEIIGEAFRRINQPVNIKVMPWARALREVQEGGADGIFSAVKTPDREQYFAYSKEVLIPLVVSFFAKKDSPIHYDGDLSKLSGYRFGVVHRFSNGPLFDGAVKSGLLKNVDVVNGTDSNVKKLIAGRIDIMVSNRYGALFFLKKNNVLDQVIELSPEIDHSASYLAFTKKRDLGAMCEAFDKALAGMKKDGTYHRIIASYGR